MGVGVGVGRGDAEPDGTSQESDLVRRTGARVRSDDCMMDG